MEMMRLCLEEAKCPPSVVSEHRVSRSSKREKQWEK